MKTFVKILFFFIFLLFFSKIDGFSQERNCIDCYGMVGLQKTTETVEKISVYVDVSSTKFHISAVSATSSEDFNSLVKIFFILVMIFAIITVIFYVSKFLSEKKW